MKQNNISDNNLLRSYNKSIIIGMSCSGKSTFADQLSSMINIKNYDLDDFHWLPGWIERPDEDMRKDIKDQIISNKEWIVSGNYNSVTKDLLWPEAESIIWLNYSLSTVIKRCLKRTLKRVITKEKVCNGNVETIYMAYFNRENNLLRYILNSYQNRKERYQNWMEKDFKHKKWIVLSNQKETDNILKQIRDKIA